MGRKEEGNRSKLGMQTKFLFFRRANWREQDSLGLSSWTPVYLPDVRPLGRSATAEDVKTGKAIFRLNGT